jgi:hypothetical protein
MAVRRDVLLTLKQYDESPIERQGRGTLVPPTIISPRPTFVSWKFVPTDPSDFYTWYRRIELRQRLFNGGCPTNPRIGALVLARKNQRRKARCGRLIYEDAGAAVLAMNSRS